ncbi:phage major capsid protein, P2 family [Aeromonas caviae]|uniref:Phage major capsid protein, P2 family n=1 Tax=Aeromonas caviae TaxID=648 RepID=A0AAW9F5A3_AERCA|nr:MULTISPECIES: phage major capsid protein, P2 family [Aeromonas]AJQ52640.1 capsid protein [Aeromonas hydrophila]MCR3893105.1 phage major capsid protein, P2 family [Aeromonas caviae]MDX7720782.1 phage major capsid protein, P2 family [Aeromonas caviae]MDX7811280.1 phage major capsid protein, P2 family [Aeromonas caviae]BDC85237.1 phage capsid protein [Aeromonas caviae]
MRNETRQKFNEFTGKVAKLNAITSAMVQFNVQPSVQQTLETKMQESVEFLSMINVIPVPEMKGQKVGIGISSTIAGRTDTSSKDRQPADPSALYPHDYECAKTNYDTMLGYNKLDIWAKFPDFQTRIRDAILKRQGLDRIMIGWHGTSVAKDTDRTANSLLQDVNKGWLQHIRDDAPAKVMDEVAEGSGKIYIYQPKGETDTKSGDYHNLDALVFDAVNELIEPWYQDDTDLVVICGRKLLSDKYFPIINNADDNQNKLAGQVLVSQKQIGGLKAVRVPYFPEDALLVTKLDNLSIYWQEGARRRHIEEEPKRDRIVNYESSNDAYVVEDYDCVALIENIVIGPKPAAGG